MNEWTQNLLAENYGFEFSIIYKRMEIQSFVDALQNECHISGISTVIVQ